MDTTRMHNSNGHSALHGDAFEALRAPSVDHRVGVGANLISGAGGGKISLFFYFVYNPNLPISNLS